MLCKNGNDQDLSSIGRLSVSAVGLLLLLGCSDIAGGAGQSTESVKEGSAVPITSGKLGQGNLLENLLDKAIQVGDGQYMIPKGIDEDGCEMFGAYSTSGPTITAIQYRQADGGFDIGKDPAVCKVDMVELGSDADGCEMYQAKPANGDLEATGITYYRDPDGRYVVHKAKSDCG